MCTHVIPIHLMSTHFYDKTFRDLIFLNSLLQSQREKQRNASCIVDMEDKTTILYNPNNFKAEPKKFTFDYSFWSHNGFIENELDIATPDLDHPNGYKYADQV